MKIRSLRPLVVAALLVAGCSAGGPAPASTSSSALPPAATTTTTTGSGLQPATTSGALSPSFVPAGYLALWPFTDPAQVTAWRAAFQAGGADAWHLDAERTALAFVRDRLGYTEVDRVTSRTLGSRNDHPDAVLGVGWEGESGSPHEVALLHLVRAADVSDAPWIVVGTGDTDLTLDTPRYGTTAAFPLTVGGLVTGVDESLHVVVLGPGATTPLAEVAGIPAGGEETPWTATLRLAPGAAVPPGTVLTVAVSTGGHVRDVERFAVTGVRAG